MHIPIMSECDQVVLVRVEIEKLLALILIYLPIPKYIPSTSSPYIPQAHPAPMSSKPSEHTQKVMVPVPANTSYEQGYIAWEYITADFLILIKNAFNKCLTMLPNGLIIVEM